MSRKIVTRLIELQRKLDIVLELQSMQEIARSHNSKRAVRLNESKTCRCSHHHDLEEERCVCCGKGGRISKGQCNLKEYEEREKVCLCCRKKVTNTIIDQPIKFDKSEEPNENRYGNVSTRITEATRNGDEERERSAQLQSMRIETVDRVAAAEETATEMESVDLSIEQKPFVEPKSKEKLRSASYTEGELKREISLLQKRLCQLAEERDDLMRQLQKYMENEEKRCFEVEIELSRMKHAIKDKEEALEAEGSQLRSMIEELTKIVRIQKRRICEIMRICTKQQRTLQEREMMVAEKESDRQQILCTCNQMKDEIEKLENCLKEESRSGGQVKQELETIISNYQHSIRIKEKIIEDQGEMIQKQKKLLQQSESMAQQAAREFELLTDQLYCERRISGSLQAKLDTAQTEPVNSTNCEKCAHLEYQVESLKQQRNEALCVVRFTLNKLRCEKNDFSRDLSRERRQQTILMTVLRIKEGEIECLKREILDRCSDLAKITPASCNL